MNFAFSPHNLCATPAPPPPPQAAPPLPGILLVHHAGVFGSAGNQLAAVSASQAGNQVVGGVGLHQSDGVWAGRLVRVETLRGTSHHRVALQTEGVTGHLTVQPQRPGVSRRWTDWSEERGGRKGLAVLSKKGNTSLILLWKKNVWLFYFV